MFDVLYGGARGGGKTDGCLGEWAGHSSAHRGNAVGVFFRRTLPQLDEVIARSRLLYSPLGAKFSEQHKEWTMPGGARLKFRYLERLQDAMAYQGHSYTRLYFEELTNWPDPSPIDQLTATLRSPYGVPCRKRSTANPGGPGHHWVKQRYIDPAPLGYRIITDDNGLQRVFIPAKLRDNRILVKFDPEYEARLRSTGSPELVRAWLDGDWSIIAGAFFPEWSNERHVIAPFIPPAYWAVFRALDWGFARPFSVGWYCVSDGQPFEDDARQQRMYPRGALIKFREWYGWTGKPNDGLRMTATEVAGGIKQREVDLTKSPRTVSYGTADPSIFQHDGGPSHAETFANGGVYWQPADNKRPPGWDQVRDRLRGTEDGPMLYVTANCTETIRTLPACQADPVKYDDVDTEGEDHSPDETRYACMSRPWVREIVKPKKPKLLQELTYNELLAAHDQAGRRRERI